MSSHAGLRRSAAFLVLALCGAVAAFATIAPPAELLLARTVEPEQIALPQDKTLLAAPASYVWHERFERGDTLAGLLARLDIGAADTQALARMPQMKLVRPGVTLSAAVGADGALQSLEFLSPRDALVRIVRDGADLRAAEATKNLTTVQLLRSSVIHSSLFAATDAAGIPESVALQLTDIFGGDIDFHRDLRRNDHFSVIYEMHYVGGRPLRAGRVLAAEFLNQGKRLRAVWFAGSDGKGGYYAPNGKNLRKAFLRSPLEFSRVSSGFGARLHPFLRTWREHKGVDYAAAPGTRVRAVGDGVIEFAGRQAGYGNVAVLRHQGQFTTLYAHLSGFARGVRKGVRLAQGDVVGFVGQTGWATGPHLHYEFRVAGQARNPLTVALPAALPLPAQELAAFRAFAQPLAGHLDFLSNVQLAALE